MAGNGHLAAKYISSGNYNYLPQGNPIESFNKFLVRNNYSEEEQIYYDAYIHQCYVTLINDLQNK